MGGEAWSYTTRHQPDLAKALEDVREREFAAGRYGVLFWELMAFFPIGDETDAPAPGPRHESLEKLIEQTYADYDETRSILDMKGISQAPREWFVSPLSNSELISYFGTLQPTIEQVRTNQEFRESVPRATGRCVVTYADGHPEQILFFGCCAD